MHETPTMQATIDGLLQKNQIAPEKDSEWLSCPILAPKPHQKSISSADVNNYKWRVCMSYILLNSVTKVLPCPLP